MKKYLLLLLFCCSYSLLAQEDDLEAILNAETANVTIPVTGTFKSTYLQNGRTVERATKGELEFRVNHRFGAVSSGAYEFFGLDESSSLIALDYGITDWLALGVSRATIDKCWSGNARFTLLRQTEGYKAMPISASYILDAAYKTSKLTDDNPYDKTENRLFYTHQLLIARKFTTDLSVQIMPTLVHRNLVESYNDNDLYAIGLGGRYRFTNWVAIAGEYYYGINKDLVAGSEMSDSWSLGIDIDTGGHIFQLLVTNSAYLLPHQYLSRSNGQISDGTVHIGFNLMRMFSLYDK